MQVFTFGGLQILLNDEPVTGLVSRKAEALLVYLAAATRPLPRELLADLLWDDRSQQQAMSYLRVVLSSLRKQLAPFLTITRHTAALNPDANVQFDAAELESVLSQVNLHGGTAGPEEIRRMESAVSLYQGDFLAGFHIREASGFEEWATVERERLRQVGLDGLEDLARYYLDHSEYQAGISHARQLLQLDPLRESGHRLQMRLFAGDGRRGEALAQYEVCCRLLDEELGVIPAVETTTLAEAIRSGEYKSGAVQIVAVPSVNGAALPRFLDPEARAAKVDRPVFVARERQLARMNDILQESLAGDGRVMFVTGGPGRGKSALMAEFGWRAQESHPDLLVAGGSCNAFSGIGDPYLPFREVMGMLTGDVEVQYAAGSISGEQARRLWGSAPRVIQAILEHGPSLFDSILPGRPLLARAATMAHSSPWLEQLRKLVQREQAGLEGLGQSHLFQQFTNVLRAVTSEQALLLLIDDMQWADNASMSLLFHFGRRLAGLRVAFACAYRPEEVALGRGDEPHPLEPVLAEFKRAFGDVWIDLGKVDESEGRRFVDALLETEPNRLGESFRAALCARTGGHALFTVELLRAMQDRGDLVWKDGHWVEATTLDWEMLPARVEATIAARIDRLEKEQRETLSIASVEGQVFTAEVVAQVLGIGERRLFRKLSQELAQRYRLVREVGVSKVGSRSLSRYRFSHALFQQYLYENLSLGERRLLHGEIAAALEVLLEGARDEIAVPLAHHYSQASDDQNALKYLGLAGSAARAVYAFQEAENHFRKALALSPSQLERADLLYGLGESLYLQYKLQEAAQAWREALDLYQNAGPKGLDGMALTYSALVHQLSFETPLEAMKFGQAALYAVAGGRDTSGMAWLLHETARACYFSGSPEEASEFCGQGIDMARRIEDVRLEAECLVLQGILPNQLAQDSINALLKAMDLAESVGAIRTVMRALNNVSLRVPDLRARSDYLVRAIALDRRIGTSTTEVLLPGNLCRSVFFKLGTLDEVKKTLKTMRHILTELPEPEWTQVAVIRLTEVELLICQGRWGQAIEPLREYQADARQHGDAQYLMEADSSLAYALLESRTIGDDSQTGGLEEAEVALTEAVEIGRRVGASTEWPTLQRCYLVRLRIAQGLLELARSLLVEARAARDAAGLQINLMTEAYLLSAEAVLAAGEGDYAEAIKTFAEAVETFEQLGMRWDHARILADWAGAHLARNEPGDKRQARALLRESLAMFEDMGAPGYEAVVAERLQAVAQ